MNIYVVMLIGGLIGIVLHSFKAVRDIAHRNDKMNFRMVLIEYWQTEYLSIAASALTFGAMMFVASEFVDLHKIDTPDYTEPLKDRLLHFKISNFIKLTSIIAGYFSDSIVYSFLGVSEKRLQKRIADLDDSGTTTPDK
jgi:hypothetical protein